MMRIISRSSRLLDMSARGARGNAHTVHGPLSGQVRGRSGPHHPSGALSHRGVPGLVGAGLPGRRQLVGTDPTKTFAMTSLAFLAVLG